MFRGYGRIGQLISFFSASLFLFSLGCSKKLTKVEPQTQAAQVLKAKIVYYAMPG